MSRLSLRAGKFRRESRGGQEGGRVLAVREAVVVVDVAVVAGKVGPGIEDEAVTPAAVVPGPEDIAGRRHTGPGLVEAAVGDIGLAEIEGRKFAPVEGSLVLAAERTAGLLQVWAVELCTGVVVVAAAAAVVEASIV